MDRKEVLRYLRTKSTTEDRTLLSIIDKAEKCSYESVRPKTIYKIYDCKVEKDSVSLAGVTFKSKRLAENLKGCKKVLLFAATLGTECDRLLRLAETQGAAQMAVYQAVLAAMIEEVCDNLEKEITEEYGFSLCKRFSPGYFDLNIKEQKKVFNLLDITKRTGITLTDSFQMIPSKSVTAFIGIKDEN